jgi:hypothetical protein
MLKQEVSGDRPPLIHRHDTGCARDLIAAAPTVEDGKEARRRREGHHCAVTVGGRAGGPAIDLCGTGGTGPGGHRAVTEVQEPRLVDRERERLRGKCGGDRPPSIQGHCTRGTSD